MRDPGCLSVPGVVERPWLSVWGEEAVPPALTPGASPDINNVRTGRPKEGNNCQAIVTPTTHTLHTAEGTLISLSPRQRVLKPRPMWGPGGEDLNARAAKYKKERSDGVDSRFQRAFK